jgi:DNA-binding MarR family transcriptional regulator
MSKRTKKDSEEKALDPGCLPELLGYHLRLAQIAVFADFAKALKAYDLLPGQFGVLELVGANPGLSQNQLAGAIKLDRSTLVSTLNRLAGRELVERRVSATDRRSNTLWLTKAGQELLVEIAPKVKAHEKRLFSIYSPEERKMLRELLSRLNSAAAH